MIQAAIGLSLATEEWTIVKGLRWRWKDKTHRIPRRAGYGALLNFGTDREPWASLFRRRCRRRRQGAKRRVPSDPILDDFVSGSTGCAKLERSRGH